MAEEDDPADLFTVPDLWRPCSWLQRTIGDINRQHPLFAFDLSDAACRGPRQNLLPPQAVEDDGDLFFKLPTLLKDLAGQEGSLNSQQQAFVENPEFEPLSVPVPVPLPVPGSGHEPGRELGPEPQHEAIPSSDDDDFWLAPGTHDSHRLPEYKTWESFEQNEQASHAPLFLTEAGPSAFDALLASAQSPGDAVADILDAASYIPCLLSLALGRSSILFSWDAEKNSFVKTAPYLRISGLSLDSIKAVDSLCLDCGNFSRHLQAFVEVTYSAASTPARVALAGVVDRLVVVVRSQLSARGRDVRSILQLQAAVQPAQSLLSYFKQLVSKLAQQTSDEAMLSALFLEAQASEYRDPLLRAATREVLRVLSKPWAEFVEEWIGLRTEGGIPVSKQGPGKGFVKVASKIWIDDQGFELEEPDYFLDEDRVPAFLPEDMTQTILETGRNLRFLREYHPEHPLSRPDVVAQAMPPSLEWTFDWDAISKLQVKVHQYRNAVSRAIRDMRQETQQRATSPDAGGPRPDHVELACFGKTEAQVEADILSSMRQLDQPLESGEQREDNLTLLPESGLYEREEMSLDLEALSPHWALVPLLSFGPIVEAQSSLINRECMKVLFSSHHLRVHVDLLRQYFLLGNGLLCSRLSHALFDPNLETAERRSGVALGGGIMGLRLEGRQTWPPASSELRLALMGVLSECYEPPPGTAHQQAKPSGGAKSDLPGDLSFAVRDLSEEEIDRCMNPDSLEALDFLRLSYKPPPPLRPVMAPTVLLKYDRVFKLLLRVLRMLYVANELFLSSDDRDPSNASLRFRIEARHFIRQVASYFFDVGIAAPWRRFEAWLDKVEAELLSPADGGEDGEGNDDNPAAAKAVCSPDALRERQEQTLDEIMSVLLLRKRQAPVLALLEEVFAVVLRFAAAGRRQQRQTWPRHPMPGGGEGGESPEALYRLFRKKVEVFVTVCRGLAEKMSASSSSSVTATATATATAGGGGRGNTVEQLLVMLDMNGFYASSSARRAGRRDGQVGG